MVVAPWHGTNLGYDSCCNSVPTGPEHEPSQFSAVAVQLHTDWMQHLYSDHPSAILHQASTMKVCHYQPSCQTDSSPQMQLSQLLKKLTVQPLMSCYGNPPHPHLLPASHCCDSYLHRPWPLFDQFTSSLAEEANKFLNHSRLIHWLTMKNNLDNCW